MQAKLKDFHLKISRKPLRPEIRLMDVSSEIGELTKEILKATEYGGSWCFNDNSAQLIFTIRRLSSSISIPNEVGLIE